MSDTSVVTLVEFLLARIAEDEQCAAAALDQPLGYRWRSLSWLTEANRDHGQRHDPGRVLAECAAKRRIVEVHQPFTDGVYDYTTCRTCGQIADWAVPAERAAAVEEDRPVTEWWAYPCPTMRLLALPYADHPDYCEEFRP